MKNIVIALALTACSAPSIAEPVRPFALRCTSDKKSAMPISATWDGVKLTVDSPTGNLGFELEQPASSYKDRRLPYDTRWPIHIAFQERPRSVAVGTPIQQVVSGNVAFLLMFNDDGELTKGTLLKAEFSDGMLASVRHIAFGDCVSTLKP